MQASEPLRQIRAQIDQIDDQLVPLLAKRIRLALEASEHKNTDDEIRGCDRVQEVLEGVKLRARKEGGAVDSILAIYTFLVQELTTLQLRAKAGQS
ncbi:MULTISPECIES: chorismate mutase [Achromobacter]|uniref:chorismate mutase n=1 Tax=Achromobacter spanius TaxID=217203 RepID=A0ABY8GLX0_9BURK|nr:MULTISPECIES: chorismate mutase [Achromobacter]WAI84918.1 chorismate mutase [Achromobacter spanius]WEX95002.1 chorismate mutase [Achromobacter sp. SS2-2022]WFP05830.1 chorismate mutase [Achromobacter spanius]